MERVKEPGRRNNLTIKYFAWSANCNFEKFKIIISGLYV